MNTIIEQSFFGVIIALSSWVLLRLYANAVLMAEINKTVTDNKEARLLAEKHNDAHHEEIKVGLKDLVSRREFEIAITDLKLKVEELKIRTTALEVLMTDMRITLSNLKKVNVDV